MREIQHLTQEGLHAELEALYTREPALRPRAELHDYQLTYPPAIALERDPSTQRCPSDREFVGDGVGSFEGGGLYFHFGFCAYRCRYCFHYELKTTREETLMARYVDALICEMKHVRGLTSHVNHALYFLGGGTPTALPLHLLERFLGALLLHFGKPKTAMSTVEAKPVTASQEKLDALVQAGFQRINLGVQTLDPKLYDFHHHGEDVRVAFDAIERARRAGFRWINIDLMTGLEHQSPGSFSITLGEVERLIARGAIDSVFLYPFHDDPRRPAFGQENSIPSFVRNAWEDAQLRALMERLGWKELGARFYRSPAHVRRELLEVARVRVNPSYGEVLYHGFGNSSFSIGDRATYLNHRDVNAYCDAVFARGLGIQSWLPMSERQRATRDVTFDLLYAPFTRIRSRRKKYGSTAMAQHEALLARWEELELGTRHALLGTFSLSPLGKLVHQQLIPQHYLPEDREKLDRTMRVRMELGRRYRGY